MIWIAAYVILSMGIIAGAYLGWTLARERSRPCAVPLCDELAAVDVCTRHARSTVEF